MTTYGLVSTTRSGAKPAIQPGTTTSVALSTDSLERLSSLKLGDNDSEARSLTKLGSIEI